MQFLFDRFNQLLPFFTLLFCWYFIVSTMKIKTTNTQFKGSNVRKFLSTKIVPCQLVCAKSGLNFVNYYHTEYRTHQEAELLFLGWYAIFIFTHYMKSGTLNLVVVSKKYFESIPSKPERSVFHLSWILRFFVWK